MAKEDGDEDYAVEYGDEDDDDEPIYHSEEIFKL